MKYQSIEQIPTEKLEEEVNSAGLMYWTYATPNFEIENWYFKEEGYKKGLNKNFWKKLEDENKTLFSGINSNDPIIKGKSYAKLQRSVMAKYQSLNTNMVEDFVLNKKDLYQIYRKKNYPNRPEETLGQAMNAMNDVSLLMFNEIQKNYGEIDGIALDEFKKDQIFLGTQYQDEEFTKSEFKYEQNKQSFLLAAKVKSEFKHIDEKFLFKDSLVQTNTDERCEVKYRNGVYFIGNEDIKDCSFSIVEKAEKDGTPKYYITFRGTDTNIKSFGQYALEDYKNMGYHYEKMASVFRTILENIEKETPTFKVKVIGHSLGASMVERFMKEYPDTKNIKYEGLALASPGQEHWAQNLVNSIDKKKEQIHDILMEKFDPVLSFMSNLSDHRITRFVLSSLKSLFFVDEISSFKEGLMYYANDKSLFPDTKEKEVKSGIKMIGSGLDKIAGVAGMAGKIGLFAITPSKMVTTFAYAGIMGQLIIGKLAVETTEKFKKFLKISPGYIFSEKEDLRIIKVDNKEDIVPKAGSLINRQHNQSIIIDNAPEKSLFTIPILNVPVKLETDYHDKALYFMPFVKEYAKRKDATNIVLKDRIDAVLELKKDISFSKETENLNVINKTIGEVNLRILKFKENIRLSNMKLGNSNLSI